MASPNAGKLAPYDLWSCPVCGNLEEKDKSCSRCGTRQVQSSTHLGLSETHSRIYWSLRLIGGLGLILIGPFMTFYAFSGITEVYFSLGILFSGIAVTVIGSTLGLWLLVFGALPTGAGKSIPALHGSGAPWRSQQSSEMVLGRFDETKQYTSKEAPD